MVDLQRLDSIIDDLGESTANIINISNIAEKVQQTVSLVDESVSNLSDVINEVHDLNANQSAMQETISTTYQNLEEHFKTVQLQNAQLSSQVNTLLLEIKNEGYSLNKQLEVALLAKMDVLKSDILLENRSKALETQEIIAKSYKGLLDGQKHLAQSLEIVSNRLKTSYAIGGAGILVAVLILLLKLLK